MPAGTASGVGFDAASDGAVAIMDKPSVRQQLLLSEGTKSMLKLYILAQGGRLTDAQGQATVTGDPKTAMKEGKTSVQGVQQ